MLGFLIILSFYLVVAIYIIAHEYRCYKANPYGSKGFNFKHIAGFSLLWPFIIAFWAYTAITRYTSFLKLKSKYKKHKVAIHKTYMYSNRNEYDICKDIIHKLDKTNGHKTTCVFLLENVVMLKRSDKYEVHAINHLNDVYAKLGDLKYSYAFDNHMVIITTFIDNLDNVIHAIDDLRSNLDNKYEIKFHIVVNGR